MSRVKILDCTIRDGGYYNQWDFSENLVLQYLKGVEKLSIDYIEIGYRNPKVDKVYRGKFFHLDDEQIEAYKIYLPNIKLALMLDTKLFTKNVFLDQALDPIKGKIDLIRIAVDPSKLDQALEIGRKIVAKGFSLAFNLMYISSNSVNSDVIYKLSQVDFPIEYLYLVDSFGGMLPEQVSNLCQKVKQATKFKLGFHGHNNMELALANTLSAMGAGVEIVDSTILGMGRGAGNTKTELLLTYLRGRGLVECDLDTLSHIVNSFRPLHERYNWGTNLPYMISGVMNIPQGKVMDWISTNRYSENDIVNKVLDFNSVNNNFDLVKLPKVLNEEFNEIIIIGGGDSVKQNSKHIKIKNMKI